MKFLNTRIFKIFLNIFLKIVEAFNVYVCVTFLNINMINIGTNQNRAFMWLVLENF